MGGAGAGSDRHSDQWCARRERAPPNRRGLLCPPSSKRSAFREITVPRGARRAAGARVPGPFRAAEPLTLPGFRGGAGGGFPQEFPGGCGGAPGRGGGPRRDPTPHPGPRRGARGHVTRGHSHLPAGSRGEGRRERAARGGAERAPGLCTDLAALQRARRGAPSALPPLPLNEGRD